MKIGIYHNSRAIPGSKLTFDQFKCYLGLKHSVEKGSNVTFKLDVYELLTVKPRLDKNWIFKKKWFWLGEGGREGGKIYL